MFSARVCGLLLLACAVRAHIYQVGGRSGSSSTENQANVALVADSCYDAASYSLRHYMLPDAYAAPISHGAAAAIGGTMYVAGGFVPGRGTGRAVNTYTCGNWATGVPMSVARSGLGLVAVAGKLYAIGGTDGSEPLSSVERFDPESKVWEPVASMQTARSNFGTVVLGENIYVLGGASTMTDRMLADTRVTDCAPLRTVEVYNIRTNTWSYLPQNMTFARCRTAAFPFDGQIHVYGGLVPKDDNRLLVDGNLDIYDFATQRWTFVEPMSAPPLYDHAIIPLTGSSTVIMLGGSQPSSVISFVVYSFLDRLWLRAGYSNIRRAGMASAYMPNDPTSRQCGTCPDVCNANEHTFNYGDCQETEQCLSGRCIRAQA